MVNPERKMIFKDILKRIGVLKLDARVKHLLEATVPSSFLRRNFLTIGELYMLFF